MSNDLRVNIIGDSSRLKKSLNSASRDLKSFGKKVSDIGSNLSMKLTLPLTLAGGAAIKLASDFEESMNKVNVAFGESSKIIKDFAKTTLTQFGIAEGSALDMAALFGDMATSMGINRKEAADMSKSMVGLAGDLASFKNIDIDQAMTALAGVFTGETESLKRLGIVMTQTNLEAFALSQGIQKNVKDMTQAEKVNLRFAYILSQTQNAQGDFARTQGGAANQMRIFTEGTKQLGQSFGSLLLPAFTKIVTKLNSFVTAFINLDSKTKSYILTIGTIAAAIGPALVIIGKLTTAVGLLTSPIGLIAAGLATIAYIIYKNWAEVAPVVVGFYNQFVDLYNSSENIRVGIFAVGLAFKVVFKTIKMQIDQVINVFSTLWDLIKEASKGFSADFGGALKKGFEKGKQIADDYNKDIATTFVTGLTDALGNQLEKKTVESLNGTFTDIKTSIGDFFNWYGTAGGGEENNTLKNVLDQAGVSTDNLSSKFILFDEIIGQVGEQFVFAFGQAFDAIASGEDFIKSITQALIPMIKKLIAAAAAALVLSTLLGGIGITKIKGITTSFTGIFSALTGIGGGSGSGGSDTTAFAKGGIVNSPTLGLVGEYPGAKSNPEVIAPLDKLKSMIGDRGQSQVNVSGQFALRGQDLVVALQRANNNRNRVI